MGLIEWLGAMFLAVALAERIRRSRAATVRSSANRLYRRRR